ncbi:hypothetical protein [Caldicoprobacter algeriensis]|nr:hypothetical protein [Caldicoprobacter algeriensis]
MHKTATGIKSPKADNVPSKKGLQTDAKAIVFSLAVNGVAQLPLG